MSNQQSMTQIPIQKSATEMLSPLKRSVKKDVLKGDSKKKIISIHDIITEYKKAQTIKGPEYMKK